MLHEDVVKLGDATFSPMVKDADTDAWLKARMLGIGGSDAGAVMGLNSHSSPLKVYYNKKGVDGFDGNIYTRLGAAMEDFLRVEVEHELGVKIEEVGGTFVSIKHPFMRANLDGLIYAGSPISISGDTVAGLGILEIKTSSVGNGFGADEVPDSYYAQVQHYMATTGLQWAIIAAYVFTRGKICYYIVRRNDSFLKDMLVAEENFWQCIQCDTPPAPIGRDFEDELIAKSIGDKGKSVVLDDNMAVTIDAIQKLDADIKELETKKRQYRQALELAIANTAGEDSDTVTATCSYYKITWNTMSRVSADTDALKKAGLYDKYSKHSNYRMLRIKDTLKASKAK